VRHQSWSGFTITPGFPVCLIQRNICTSLGLNQNLKLAVIPLSAFFFHFPPDPKLYFETSLSKPWFTIDFKFVSCLFNQMMPPFHICSLDSRWLSLESRNLILYICYSPVSLRKNNPLTDCKKEYSRLFSLLPSNKNEPLALCLLYFSSIAQQMFYTL
jgi:hypothetical protein